MFKYYSFPPAMECYIRDCKLHVRTPGLDEEYVYDMDPTEYLTEHSMIYDAKGTIALNQSNMFSIGTEDGHIIVGTGNGKYMVLNPEGYVIGLSRWDARSALGYIQEVGMHTYSGDYHQVFRNSRYPHMIQVQGTNFYGFPSDKLIQDLNNCPTELQNLSILNNASESGSYYLCDIPLDVTDQIKTCVDDPRNRQVLNDLAVRKKTSFWRYGPGAEVYGSKQSKQSVIGPYKIPIQVAYERKFNINVPRDLALNLFYSTPDAVVMAIVNESAIYMWSDLYVYASVLERVHNISRVTKHITEPLTAPLGVKDIVHVGYKATKPLCYGAIPPITRLYSDVEGNVLGEDYQIDNPVIDPPLSLYKTMIKEGQTRCYMREDTKQIVYF